MKVLLAEHDVDLVDRLTDALRREGHSVVIATDGQQGLERWAADQPDIVVLNVDLPKLDGFEVCRRIRQEATTAIVMLSVRDSEEDILHGFELGADDFLTKPLGPEQLVARMTAVLRRGQRDPHLQPATNLHVGDLLLDLESWEVTKAGKMVRLTPLEFRILYMLAINAGRTVPYASLLSYAWVHGDGGDPIALKAHIYKIRKKVQLPMSGTGSITAVRGLGYRLVKS